MNNVVLVYFLHFSKKKSSINHPIEYSEQSGINKLFLFRKKVQ